MKKISFEKSLIGIVLILASLAAIAGSPVSKYEYPDWEFNLEDIDTVNVKFISVTELSKWIMDKRNDFIIIDSRSNAKYNRYHIPHSYHDQDIVPEITHNIQNMVIYTQDGSLPKELWTLMNSRYNVKQYLLHGGLNDWKDFILFPDINKLNFSSKEEISWIISVSRYFGGKPKLPQKHKSKKTEKYLREGC